MIYALDNAHYVEFCAGLAYCETVGCLQFFDTSISHATKLQGHEVEALASQLCRIIVPCWLVLAPRVKVDFRHLAKMMKATTFEENFTGFHSKQIMP